MAIEFHCEHCGKVIKAPVDSAGKRGKCPHCQQLCYIPAPPDEAEAYDLAPLDPEEERRRRREEAAAHELQRRLLHERKEVAGPDAPPPPSAKDEAVRPADLRAAVADYLSAMQRGHLSEADRIAYLLAANKKEVLALIERIGADEVMGAELASLPRPLLLGFLRQLRAKL